MLINYCIPYVNIYLYHLNSCFKLIINIFISFSVNDDQRDSDSCKVHYVA